MTAHGKAAEPLVKIVRKHATTFAPLVRARSITRKPRAERWQLAGNARVEPES